jgi:hypothetical protein
MILLLNGHGVRAVRGTWNRWKLAKVVRSGQPFRVDVCGPTGFGSSLTGAVLLCHYFRNCPGFRGVISSNRLYLSAEISRDVFDMFFERAGRACESNCSTVPFRFDEDVTLESTEDGLTLRDAHDLFHQNFAIRQGFLADARAIFDAGFEEAVGVHFRGSDKRLETKRIDFECVAAAVDLAMERSGCQNLFVATDEAEFLEFAERRYGKRRTRSLECKHLSDGVTGAHFLPGDGFEKGREAVVTMLILSMCKICVRGPSHMSCWASVLNPDLPVILLGGSRTTDLFPEAIDGV